MWIKTQDGMTVIDHYHFDAFHIRQNEDGKWEFSGEVVFGDDQYKWIPLGTYTTEEQAKLLLDELPCMATELEFDTWQLPPDYGDKEEQAKVFSLLNKGGE